MFIWEKYLMVPKPEGSVPMPMENPPRPTLWVPSFENPGSTQQALTLSIMVCAFLEHLRRCQFKGFHAISQLFAPFSSCENEIILKLTMFKISELPFLQKWDSSLYIHFEKNETDIS